jgi:hypothetical protein
MVYLSTLPSLDWVATRSILPRMLLLLLLLPSHHHHEAAAAA